MDDPGAPPVELVHVDVPGGRLRVRSTGRGPSALLVHGLLVNSHVWDPLVPRLTPHLRLVMPDLPLGGHHDALAAGADRSLPAHAERLLHLARRLPGPVVLVASDTGGAVAQLAVTRAPELFDRLVLLPCDAFGNCPPRPLVPARWLAAVPGAIGAAAFALRAAPVARLALALVSRHRASRAELDRLLGAVRSDRGVQRDLRGLLRHLRPQVTRAVAAELHRFERPVLIAWSRRDPLFPQEHAHRLAARFPDARVVVADRSRALVCLDRPDWLADRVLEFLGAAPDRR